MQFSGRMQAGNITFPSPSPHHPYHIPYHTPLPGQQDHELKKQYLTLLSPQQIIEICLTFDIHVPPYVKSTVWPPDINAAIATLQKTSPPTTEASNAETSANNNGPPAMGSLGESSNTPPPLEPTSKPDEPQPPDKTTPAPGPSTQASSIQNEQPGTQTSQSQPPQQPPYPHQPYGYPHPQSAYPHTPYYQHSSLGYPYSPYQMPGYPPLSHPPGFPQPQPSNPMYTNPPQQPQPAADNFTQHASTDDLPSYEEMIAEVLQDYEDTEGCAPKDLYNIMASRYPVQQNFRPSASQALRKAFKRGRFLENGGKYRINTAWEGGNTSRRTTRRPQTQASSAPSVPTMASPFTHVPLVHHPQPTAPPTAPNQSFQPPYIFPYGHPQPQPGYPGFSQPTLPPPPQPQVSTTDRAAAESDRPSHTEGDAADAYEAAQNILKAINFGSLLELSEEGEKANISQVSTTEASTSSTTHPPPINVTNAAGPSNGHDSEISRHSAVTNTPQSPSGDPRAELQAQLALLAAQLAELAQSDDESAPINQEPNQPPGEPPTIQNSQLTSLVPLTTNAPSTGTDPATNGLQIEREEEDSNDDDMEEVI